MHLILTVLTRLIQVLLLCMMQQTIERDGAVIVLTNGGQQDPGGSLRFILSQERASVTSGTGTLNFDVSAGASSFTPKYQ
jgi:hypothetical protein